MNEQDIAETEPDNGPVASRGLVSDFEPCGCEHPAWCSPEYCFVTDEQVRVHQQKPTRWEAQCVVPLRFETCLIDPADDDITYLKLCVGDLTSRDQFFGLLPLDIVRQLRDQLTEHLDAAQ